ncbi:MAG: polymer-forming cytoskeletal protein [Pseudomonadota bacterium]|nr:polymer-forming cytoskeletal protein [Pseudomonadota bacterium]
MRKKFKPPAFTTVIGSGTVIHGGLSFTGGLHLDGEIHGDVIADSECKNSTLTVSDQAKIVGDVRVANLIVNGSIDGDIDSSSLLELAENARVSGEIHYQQLEMAMGASVAGGMVHFSDDDLAEAGSGALQAEEHAMEHAETEEESWREKDHEQTTSNS